MEHRPMKFILPQALNSVSATLVPTVFAALLLFGSGATQAQDTAGEAAAPQAPAQNDARPPPTGGPSGPEPLGEGPWTLDTEEARIRVTVVTKDLERPWGLAFLPDGGMLVT